MTHSFASDYWWKDINTKPGAMVVLETELQQPIGFVHFPERSERRIFVELPAPDSLTER